MALTALRFPGRVLAPNVYTKVVNIHRAGSGAFERLVSKDLGDYLSNADAKVRVK